MENPARQQTTIWNIQINIKCYWKVYVKYTDVLRLNT